jgi:hypothetical protein
MNWILKAIKKGEANARKSLSHKGKKHSNATTYKISQSLLGKPKSLATREKMRESALKRKFRKWTDEQRGRVSDGKLCQAPPSDKTKRKISLTIKSRWEDRREELWEPLGFGLLRPSKRLRHPDLSRVPAKWTESLDWPWHRGSGIVLTLAAWNHLEALQDPAFRHEREWLLVSFPFEEDGNLITFHGMRMIRGGNVKNYDEDDPGHGHVNLNGHVLYCAEARLRVMVEGMKRPGWLLVMVCEHRYPVKPWDEEKDEPCKKHTRGGRPRGKGNAPKTEKELWEEEEMEKENDRKLAAEWDRKREELRGKI